jgi:2-keto-3-deoxy-L-rhamnonate aldolase RhmA
MVWAIIGVSEAVQNIEAILDIEGIDAVGFGHQDYAVAAGLPLDAGPQIDEAREKVREAAQRKGKLMWWNTDRFEVVEEKRKQGIQIFLMGVDIIYLDALLRDIIKNTKGRP